jgi:hypothetical protein
MFDDDDIPAVLSILSLYTRAWDERAADRKLKEEIEARLLTYSGRFEKLRAALSLYGINPVEEHWSQDIKKRVGAERYYAALRKGGRIVKNSTASVEDSKETAEDHSQSKLSPNAPVREIVLDRLKTAGSIGAKAVEIRAYAEKLRGIPLHEKTVGMTLYRLSNEGLVRRDGHTWFFVPQDADTKNPGGETPGPINRDD